MLLNSIYEYISRKTKRFKPTVRVNFHDENGHTEREEVDLPSLLVMDQEVNPHEISESADPAQVSDSELELATDHDLDEEYHEGSSLYYQKVERKQKAWEDLRELTVERALQFVGKRVRTTNCIHCGVVESNFKCKDCGPMATFCQDCMLKIHTNANIFHSVEILKVMTFLGLIYDFNFPRPVSTKR